MVGVDYAGLDINGYNSIPGSDPRTIFANALACQAQCQLLPACTHFTFATGGASAGQCWLKTGPGTSQNVDPNFTSGPKFC